MSKLYGPAADRNKHAIADVLEIYLKRSTRLLEIGSGSGQHAIFLGEEFPSVQWITSEVKGNLKGLAAELKAARIKNVHGPEKLNIGKDDFPKGAFDYAFTANTLHIMSWKECKGFFKLLGKRLREGSIVFFYGPFNYGGEFTSESNEKFNTMLKERNQNSGIRNFEDIKNNMEKAGFALLEDHEMPANNRILVFSRLAFVSH